MDLAEWFTEQQKLHAEEQRFQVVRSEAHLILAALQQNPREAITGLAGVTEAAELARRELQQAKIRAMNGSAPEPSIPEATAYCGWCGEDKFVQLANDGMPDNPEWFCKDLQKCQKRRSQRYPDRDTAELQLARQADAYFQCEVDAAVFALTAWRQARQQQGGHPRSVGQPAASTAPPGTILGSRVLPHHRGPGPAAEAERLTCR